MNKSPIPATFNPYTDFMSHLNSVTAQQESDFLNFLNFIFLLVWIQQIYKAELHVDKTITFTIIL